MYCDTKMRYLCKNKFLSYQGLSCVISPSGDIKQIPIFLLKNI